MQKPLMPLFPLFHFTIWRYSSVPWAMTVLYHHSNPWKRDLLTKTKFKLVAVVEKGPYGLFFIFIIFGLPFDLTTAWSWWQHEHQLGNRKPSSSAHKPITQGYCFSISADSSHCYRSHQQMYSPTCHICSCIQCDTETDRKEWAKNYP